MTAAKLAEDAVVGVGGGVMSMSKSKKYRISPIDCSQSSGDLIWELADLNRTGNKE